MIYKRLTIAGFGPHQKSINYDFETGVTLITGPNGSGKSSIIDALHWALFGPKASHRTLTDRMSIINSSVNTARVSLSFESDDGSEVEFTRTLTRAGKHSLSLEVDGEAIGGGVTELQRRINEEIGTGPDVFSAAAMITSSPSVPMNSFLIAPTADKKAILSQITDPQGKWEKANKVMRARLREEKAELATLNGRLDMVREMRANAPLSPEPDQDVQTLRIRRSEILEIISESDGHRDLASRRKSAEALRRSERRMGTLTENIDRLKKTISAAADRKRKASRDAENAKQDVIEAESELDYVDSELKASDVVIKYLSESLDEINYTVEDANRAAQVLDAMTPQCSCCHEVIDGQVVRKHISDTGEDHNRQQRDELLTYQSSLRKRASALRRDADDTEASYRHALTIVSDMEERLTEAMGQLEQAEAEHAIISDEVEQGRKAASAQDDGQDATALIDELEDVESDLAEVVATQQRIKDEKERISELDSRVDESMQAIDIQDRIVQHFISLVAVTGPDGAVAEELSDLCEEIADHAKTAYKGAYGVDLDIAVDYEHSVGVLIAGRDLTTYSHGEQARVIPSVLVGLAASVNDRLGVDLPLLWDEPSIAVDSADVDKMVSMLAPSKQAIVILRETSIDADSVIHLDNDEPARLGQ